MTLKNVLTLNAIVALLFGLAFLLVPAALVSAYGMTLSPGGLLVGRLFGAALLGYAALTWLAREADESEARRAIVLGLFVGFLLGLLASLLGQLQGAVNSLGWSTVVIYLLFTLAYGYLQFMRS